MSYNVITFGSATVDIYADTYDRKSIKKDKRYSHQICYMTGAKILIQDLKISVGGGGTNTAFTFARFGLQTAYCGCVGKDTNGTSAIGTLQKEGIDFVGHMSDSPTSTSIILDSIEHDRTILTYKGASNDLAYKTLEPHKLHADLFYFSSLLEEALETQEKIISLANKETKIAFNPSSYQAKLGYKKLGKILAKTNFLILNKGEAQELLGITEPQEKVLLEELKTKIHEEGIVLITDGSRGAYCYDGKNAIHIPARKIDVKESTGAGDAFASGFLGALLKGENLPDALTFGMANAESVIQSIGAKEGILTWNEAKKANRSHKITRL